MFYGIDLAKEDFKAALLQAEGDDVRMITCPFQADAFDRFKARLRPEDHVAVEASTNSFWFVDQIKGLVADCSVLDPYKLSIIYRSPKKTDTSDAQKIAHKLKYHVLYDHSGSEFPSIYIPTKEIQELRSILATHETMKKELVMTKNRIRSLLTQHGYLGLKRKDLSLKKHQDELRSLDLPRTVQVQIALLIDQVNTQEELLGELKDLAIRSSKPYQREVSILTSIKGISPYVAVVLIADIADIARFTSVKRFCSYMGAAPKIDASGESTRIGRINKHSRRQSLTVLVECINHFRAGSKKLDQFYIRKSVGKSRGKVRIALVRKILVAIYHMLRRNEYFHDRQPDNHERKMLGYEKILNRVA